MTQSCANMYGHGRSPQSSPIHFDMLAVQALLLAKGCLASGARLGPELFTCDSESCCYAFCAGQPRASVRAAPGAVRPFAQRVFVVSIGARLRTVTAPHHCCNVLCRVGTCRTEFPLQAVYFGSAPLRGLTKSSPPMPPRPALGIASCARPQRERISPAMYWAGRAATVRTGQHALMDPHRTLFVAPTQVLLGPSLRRALSTLRAASRSPAGQRRLRVLQCHGQGNLASRSMPICSGRHLRQLTAPASGTQAP